MEFKCDYCGKTFAGKNPSKIYRFCSQSCAARGRLECGCDKTLEWKREGELWQCPYNNGVNCRIRTCSRCGWNQAVAEARRREATV